MIELQKITYDNYSQILYNIRTIDYAKINYNNIIIIIFIKCLHV